MKDPQAQLPLRVFLLVATCFSLGAVAEPVATSFVEDIAEPLDPRQSRKEVDLDRTRAAARVAVGRLHFQREEYSLALRAYQRAYRYDADSISVLREIIPLQLALSRHDEAARYAVVAGPSESQDASLLRRLALILTESLEFEDALNLYEKASEFDDAEVTDAIEVLGFKVEMARLYHLTQDYEKAAAAFDEVREELEHPDRVDINERMKQRILGRPETTYALMGYTYIEVDRTADAMDVFQKAYKAKENKPRLAYRLARVKARAGEYQQALDTLQEYFDAKASDEGIRAYKLLKELLEKNSANPEAARNDLITRLVAMVEVDSSNTDLQYFLAEQYHQADKLAQARDAYGDVLELQADIRAYFGLVDLLREMRRSDEMLLPLAKIVAVTGSLSSLGQRVDAIAQDKALVDDLLSACQKRLEADNVDEQTSEVCVAIGMLALKAGRHDEADKLYDSSLELSAAPQEELILTWVQELILSGRFEKAVKTLREALGQNRVDSEQPYLHFLLAGALEMAERTDEAIQAVQKAIELRSDSLHLRSREAWILYHAKRYDEAKSKYESLIKDFGDDHSTRVGRETIREARFVLSNICVIDEDFGAAEEWLEQVLDEFPRDIGAMNDLGYLFADRGKQLERSLRMVNRAVEAEPNNEAYLDSVGWTLFKLGRFEEALKYLEKASDRENPDGVILDHLGDVYWQTKRHVEATDMWQRAMKAFEHAKNPSQRRITADKIERYRSSRLKTED